MSGGSLRFPHARRELRINEGDRSAATLAPRAPMCDVAERQNRPLQPKPRAPMTLSPGRLFRTATHRSLGPFAYSRGIVKVTVRDKDSRIVRVLTSERDLAAFRALWAALVEADPGSWTPPPGAPYYRLTIQSVGRSGGGVSASWFYFPGGYIRLLAILRAIWVAPLYRTPSSTAFEALLRADPL